MLDDLDDDSRRRTCELGVDLGADANETTRNGKLEGILLSQERHDAWDLAKKDGRLWQMADDGR